MESKLTFLLLHANITFCDTTFSAKNCPKPVIVYIRFLPPELRDSRLGRTDDEPLVCIDIILGIIIAIIIYLYSGDHYIRLYI